MKFTEVIPEFLGTFALIFSILSTGNFVVIGLTLAIVIYLVGDLSGANVNPVVSFVLFLNNQMSSQKLLEYIIAQTLGGLLALGVYKLIIKNVRA